MKLIKKVAATPVPPNTGDIIDSFSTSDDKHTNAPSLNAVETKLQDYKINGDFAIITGTITLTNGSGLLTLNYPEGFTASNCVPIATGIDIMAAGYYSYNTASGMVFETRLAANNIHVDCNPLEGVGPSSTKNVKVVLMKVS